MGRRRPRSARLPRGGIWRAACAGLLLSVGASARAHHSVLPFDVAMPTTITGRLTRVLWQNPHTYLAVDHAGGQGVVSWMIEVESAVVLERLGWTEASVRPGDTVTVVGARARDRRPLMRCAFVTLANGQRLACFPNARDTR